jgi:hypothetical protein
MRKTGFPNWSVPITSGVTVKITLSVGLVAVWVASWICTGGCAFAHANITAAIKPRMTATIPSFKLFILSFILPPIFLVFKYPSGSIGKI